MAQLPSVIATKKLTLFIEAQPGRAAAHTDSAAIAARLIELLPRKAGFSATSRNTPNNIGASFKSRPWWVYVILMSFLLGTQFIIASRHLPAKLDSVQPKVSAASARIPAVNAGHDHGTAPP